MAIRGNKVTELEMALLLGAGASNPWKQELASQRAALFAAGHFDYNVSGPWPVKYGADCEAFIKQNGFITFTGGGFDGTIGNPGVISLYFPAAAGANQSATLEQFNDFLAYDEDQSGVAPTGEVTANSMTVKVFIGGDTDVLFEGRLLISVLSDTTPSLSVSTNFPEGGTWNLVDSFGNEHTFETNFISRTLSLHVDYVFTVSVSGTNAHFHIVKGLRASRAKAGDPLFVGALPRITASINRTPVEVAGIHNTLKVWKLDVATADDLNNGFGLYYYRPGRGYVTNGRNYTSSIAGLWAGITSPIQSLFNPTGYMPWNDLTITGEPAPGVTPQEKETLPKFVTARAWTPNTFFDRGDYVTAGGFWLLCTTPGVSDGDQTGWPALTPGLSFADNLAVWRVYSYTGVVARYRSFPVYPFKKLGDLAGSQISPESLPNWNNWYGGWLRPESPLRDIHFVIRSVRVNRIRSESADKNEMDNGGEIPVRLGCIRNGNFVEFGTYNTGDYVRPDGVIEVFWPCFTRDVLVYDATERLDVQAEIIYGSYFSFPGLDLGPGVGEPLLADFYNDTINCRLLAP